MIGTGELSLRHPAIIKAVLRTKFGSVSAFERARELPAGSVRDVLRGRSVKRTAVALADALGVPIDVLFPVRRKSEKSDDASQKRDEQRLIAKAA